MATKKYADNEHHIYRLLNATGLSINKLEDGAGLGNATVAVVVKSKEPKELSRLTIDRIAQFLLNEYGFTLNKDWMANGEGAMILPGGRPESGNELKDWLLKEQITEIKQRISILERKK